jgi:hypothetical protein
VSGAMVVATCKTVNRAKGMQICDLRCIVLRTPWKNDVRISSRGVMTMIITALFVLTPKDTHHVPQPLPLLHWLRYGALKPYLCHRLVASWEKLPLNFIDCGLITVCSLTAEPPNWHVLLIMVSTRCIRLVISHLATTLCFTLQERGLSLPRDSGSLRTVHQPCWAPLFALILDDKHLLRSAGYRPEVLAKPLDLV